MERVIASKVDVLFRYLLIGFIIMTVPIRCCLPSQRLYPFYKGDHQLLPFVWERRPDWNGIPSADGTTPWLKVRGSKVGPCENIVCSMCEYTPLRPWVDGSWVRSWWVPQFPLVFLLVDGHFHATFKIVRNSYVQDNSITFTSLCPSRKYRFNPNL